MEMSVLLVIFLVLILSIALYYGLLGVDMGIINDDYVIPVAILFLLITTGGFTGNNGFTGDFGLDYCNDKDSITYIEETEREILHPNSFFACELGYVDGVVDLGWNIYTDDIGTPSEIEPWWQVMILNHDNYKKFVNGETYGFSNFHLSGLQTSLSNDRNYDTGKYVAGITLHSDTYFFVVDRGYEGNRGLIGPNSPTGSSDSVYFHYTVDLDYDTSGVITTN